MLLLEGQVHDVPSTHQCPRKTCHFYTIDHSLEERPYVLTMYWCKEPPRHGKAWLCDKNVSPFVSDDNKIPPTFHVNVSYKVGLKNKPPQQGARLWQTNGGLEFLVITVCTGCEGTNLVLLWLKCLNSFEFWTVLSNNLLVFKTWKQRLEQTQQNHSTYRIPQINTFLLVEKKLKNVLNSAKPGNKILWLKMGVRSPREKCWL